MVNQTSKSITGNQLRGWTVRCDLHPHFLLVRISVRAHVIDSASNAGSKLAVLASPSFRGENGAMSSARSTEALGREGEGEEEAGQEGDGEEEAGREAVKEIG